MIALDANTALRSFRDSTYDLVELSTGFSVLMADTPSVHMFKYADGKVQPMIPAALFHSLVTSFSFLTVSGMIGIGVSGGGVVLSCATEQYKMLSLTASSVLPDTLPLAVAEIEALLKQLDASIGLQAAIDGSVLHHVGDGPVPIEQGHIGQLVVEGLLTAESAGNAFEGKSVANLSAKSFDMQAGTTYMEAVSVGEAVQVTGVGSSVEIGRLAVSELLFPSDSLSGGTTSSAKSINELDAHFAGAEGQLSWFGIGGAEPEVLSMVRLTGTGVKIKFPAVLVSDQGSARYSYCIPYTADGVTSYPEVASIRAALLDRAVELDAPAGMTDFLIWPCWATIGTGSGRSYSTSWQARVLDTGSPFSVVVVQNATSAPLDNVANVWAFGTYVSQGVTYGSVNVLHRVTLPPYSSLEFLFSYDSKANIAYMNPMRAL